MTNIIIHGCNGTMGKVVTRVAMSDPDINIVAGIDKISDKVEKDFPVYQSLEECKVSADVIIDFSVHTAVPALIESAEKRGIPVVIATTGLSEDNMNLIIEKSKNIPIFQSANMSLGINVTGEMAKLAACVLGDKFDIEIVEKHHNQKVDAPSGTAYMLADTINSMLNPKKEYTYGRHSKNDKRSKNEIGIHAIRGGTIVGEHSIIFAGQDEVIEIKHTAFSKQIFAIGAIQAAKFLIGKTPNLYNMDDLIETGSLN
ncbi:4-hydroxy-tetrahydrodipicolinate reductase [Xylanivirga thermophila]|jgi:4-hydroxy-tetrahydrodipicolinate reductase|uniref:4-hydroxy-tetrahydrodipicolinate reductase n=1 Tax=Xylanivirga thermophila TaxID=2496273 RepID=UPI00101C7F1F|nr:4-hydroxy-tetrahydrodipicolinate reductase [Xylanivirga thermophila]